MVIDSKIIKMPNLLLIGSGGRNSGKTLFASTLIKIHSARTDITGIKITIVDREEGTISKENHFADLDFDKPYWWIEETQFDSDKDTARLLKAGAKKVFWLRTFRDTLEKGFNDVLKQIPDGTAIVCESNSLRKIVLPGLFIIVKNCLNSELKPSARELYKLSDRIITFDETNTKSHFDIDMHTICFENSKWTIKAKK